MINSFIYVAALLALSGLGITFLNPESLLALCFFIFVGLILHYSEPFAESLAQSRKAVQDELLNTMISSQKMSSINQTKQNFYKSQLYAGLKLMINV